MKTAVLCFPSLDWKQIQMPIGLYKIAEYCKSHYKIIIVDARLENPEEAIREILKKEDVLCIGFSVMIGSQIDSAIDLSQKFHGLVPIVWGGGLPTILPELVKKNEFVDYVLRGDGEASFLELLFYLDNRQAHISDYMKIHVFDTIEASYINFSNISIPDAYFISRDGFSKSISIETSRGCPHRCAFCHNTLLKHPYRAVSSSKVAESLTELEKKYTIDGIVFQEDNMFFKRQRAIEIMKHLEEKQSIGWKANSRIDYFKKLVLDGEVMRLIESSRCHTLQFGIESGTQRILKMIHKNITAEDVLWVNRKLADYKVNIRYNFIIGFPTETEEEIKLTLDFAERLQSENKNVEPPFINIYTPMPGTPLYMAAIEDGFVAPETLSDWAGIHWNESNDERWPRRINPLINQMSQSALSRSRYLKSGTLREDSI